MNILLQRLIETPADDEKLIIEHGCAEVTLLHMRYRRQVLPLPLGGEAIGDLVGDPANAETADLQHSHLHAPRVEQVGGESRLVFDGLHADFLQDEAVQLPLVLSVLESLIQNDVQLAFRYFREVYVANDTDCVPYAVIQPVDKQMV